MTNIRLVEHRLREDTWTEEEIAAFEAKFPVGTKERTAFALGLYTAQRPGDIIRLGARDIRDGFLHIERPKTGMHVVIPVHPELARVLEATPSKHLTFLTTRDGRPFTPSHFSHWFCDACRKAGMPKGLSIRGLRKAADHRLIYAGCSFAEIAVLLGVRGYLRGLERQCTFRVPREVIASLRLSHKRFDAE